MSWITLVEIVVLWIVVGFGVACLFGRFVQGMEAAGTTGELASAAVTYLDRGKRARTASRANTETRRAAGGERRRR
ncbi:MAG: hypothetical protein WBO23_13235 [Burkholderiales bacterium]